MRTLVISNLYPPNALGGYERLCFSVAEALVSSGHQVGVLTSSYGGETADYPGQTIWRSLSLLASEGNIYRPFDASANRRDEINRNNLDALNAVAREFQPDVIFVWNLFFFDSTLLLEIEERYADKAVYFLTDNWLINFYNGDFLGQYFSRVIFGTESEEDVVHGGPPVQLRGRAIYGSAFMARFYANAGIRFASNEVIHNGVHLPIVREEEYRDHLYPLRFGRLKLLFAGRVVDVKGVDTAIRTLPLLAKRLPHIDVSLDIVGDCQDDDYGSLLMKIVEENNLVGMVNFREPVPQDRLFGLFQEFDIYVFPSTYEPFALTLIYAMHAGIPTVASNVGGNPEIVFNNETGALFCKSSSEGLANEVLNFHDNPLRRAQISRRARLVALQFTFGNFINSIDINLRRNSTHLI